VAELARDPLVAFNVNLRGSLQAAREIAALVREDGGGFAGVRALGLELAEAGLVQVSMNIEDWRLSPLAEVVTRIGQEAGKRGAEIAATELVGLIPAGAAAEAERAGLQFDSNLILESRLA
jgi:glutamate formiminotransferase